MDWEKDRLIDLTDVRAESKAERQDKTRQPDVPEFQP